VFCNAPGSTPAVRPAPNAGIRNAREDDGRAGPGAQYGSRHGSQYGSWHGPHGRPQFRRRQPGKEERKRFSVQKEKFKKIPDELR
jgi:hypothetical protein